MMRALYLLPANKWSSTTFNTLSGSEQVIQSPKGFESWLEEPPTLHDTAQLLNGHNACLAPAPNCIINAYEKIYLFWGKMINTIIKNEIRTPPNLLFFSCVFLTPETTLPIYFCVVDMETLHMPGSQQLLLDEGHARTQPRGPSALSAGSPSAASMGWACREVQERSLSSSSHHLWETGHIGTTQGVTQGPPSAACGNLHLWGFYQVSI